MNQNTQPSQEELYATLRVLRNIHNILNDVPVRGLDNVQAMNEASVFVSTLIKAAEAKLPKEQVQEETK